MNPYYADEHITLYHGDCRAVVEDEHLTADLIVTDPPYGETDLAWDTWPAEWPTAISNAAASMWCFGSMRMFTAHWSDFMFWRLSQDVVWRKPRSTNFLADRFARVHEHALHFYRGNWSEIYHNVPRDRYYGPSRGAYARNGTSGEQHAGGLKATGPRPDDGTRLAETVIEVGFSGSALHPTQKPVGILAPLLHYGCPPGGTVLDPFAGSGSIGEAARLSGRRAILIEADEPYCETIAHRFAQGFLADIT
jgi:site-specific DNA-methyltransferase (adenine-specific)